MEDVLAEDAPAVRYAFRGQEGEAVILERQRQRNVQAGIPLAAGDTGSASSERRWWRRVFLAGFSKVCGYFG